MRAEAAVIQRLLARVYDPIAAASLREPAIAARMIDELAPIGPRRIVHLGCGRGWLTLLVARRFPHCEVIGVDLDVDIVAGAVDQARRVGQPVRFVVGRAEAPPIEGAVDAIVSSLLFHHLPRAAKQSAFASAARLLRPGGKLLLADFGRPQDAIMRGAFVGVQLAHGFDDTTDNLDGSYSGLMRAVGLDVREVERWRSWLGSVSLYSARAPS